MGTCNSAESPRKRGSFWTLVATQPCHRSSAAGKKLDEIKEKGDDKNFHQTSEGGKKRLSVECTCSDVHVCPRCVPVHKRVRGLQNLRVCEREWGIVSNGDCVYCSQMWTGMWRAGMQWFLQSVPPLFLSSLPFVPISCLTLPKTPLFAPQTFLCLSIPLECLSLSSFFTACTFSSLSVFLTQLSQGLLWHCLGAARQNCSYHRSTDYPGIHMFGLHDDSQSSCEKCPERWCFLLFWFWRDLNHSLSDGGNDFSERKFQKIFSFFETHPVSLCLKSEMVIWRSDICNSRHAATAFFSPQCFETWSVSWMFLYFVVHHLRKNSK